MRDDKEKLLDILDAIGAINKYADQGREAFDKEELIQTWVVHHLQVLGEAAAKISQDFQNKSAQIPWYKIIGMRNILVHNYFDIDVEVVWSAVQNDLPKLKDQIEKLLEKQ